MDTEISIIVSVTLFKISCLTIGLISIYFGYRLFLKGIWGQAGNLSGNFGNNKLVLKNGAPGTFFTLFGTVIIVATIWTGLEFTKQTTSSPNNANTIETVEAPELPDNPPN